MARVFGVAFLVILTIIQKVNAVPTSPCKDKGPFDDCGDNRKCWCADFNVNNLENEGGLPRCNNLVCRDLDCLFFTGVPGQRKMVEGEVVSCSTDEDCGNDFVCMFGGFCCRKPTGNVSK